VVLCGGEARKENRKNFRNLPKKFFVRRNEADLRLRSFAAVHARQGRSRDVHDTRVIKLRCVRALDPGII
jgi:hypothetical protein